MNAMNAMNPIETAPRDGTPIYISNGDTTVLMSWNQKTLRWEGKWFGIMGPIAVYWDESQESPTHWAKP